MASEVKYKKGGGNSCAINGHKLNEWKQTFSELHKEKHEDYIRCPLLEELKGVNMITVGKRLK